MWSLMPWKQNNTSQNRSLTAEPFEREFLRIRDDFDRLLQSMWGGNGAELSQLFMGSGLEETETHYVFEMEAPGFEAGDFDVQTSGDRVIVKAERKASEDAKHGRRYSYGSLQRSFTLPQGARKDEIEAQYRNGILELRIPKNPEAQHVKKIAVKAA